MNLLQETSVQCPYCGEFISVILDCSITQQQYIEDCQVCCQPINFTVTIDDNDNPQVSVFRDDE